MMACNFNWREVGWNGIDWLYHACERPHAHAGEHVCRCEPVYWDLLAAEGPNKWVK